MTELPGLAVEEREDRVVVTLSRPEVRNAIDAEMVASLHAVCASLEQVPRPMIVTGGHEVFAGGADIRQLRDRRAADALTGISASVFDRIAGLPMPTVAAVAGPALGGGAELAYACDFRIATPTARFGNPEPGLGILAAAGASWRLQELVGVALGREVLLAGRVLSSEEAHAVHLVNEVCDAEQLIVTAHSWVDRILRSAPTAIRLTKLALRMPRDAHPAFDNVAQAVLFETAEKNERMDAFLNRSKRAP